VLRRSSSPSRDQQVRAVDYDYYDDDDDDDDELTRHWATDAQLYESHAPVVRRRRRCYSPGKRSIFLTHTYHMGLNCGKNSWD